jgi:DNA-binding IclR family transcriptional regulator
MSPGGPAAAEAWWALTARVLSFFVGMGIAVWQTVILDVPQPWSLAVAVGMMGPAAASATADVLLAARGKR